MFLRFCPTPIFFLKKTLFKLNAFFKNTVKTQSNHGFSIDTSLITIYMPMLGLWIEVINTNMGYSSKYDMHIWSINMFANIFFFIIWYFCWFGWHAGFENAAVACCSTGMFEMGYACSRLNPFTCNDADKYVFWDAFHPTQKTNSIIAYYVVKKVLAQFLWSIMPKNRCTFL